MIHNTLYSYLNPNIISTLSGSAIPPAKQQTAASKAAVITSIITCCFVNTVEKTIKTEIILNTMRIHNGIPFTETEKAIIIKHMEQCILGIQFFPL